MRIIFVYSFFMSFQSSACTCPTLKPISEVDLSNAKTIFVGEVVEVKQKDNILEVLVRVKKGLLNINKQELVKINTLLDDGLCGVNVHVGEKRYFFIDDIKDGTFWIDECDRGGILSRKKFKKSLYGEDYRLHKKAFKTNVKKIKKEVKYLKKHYAFQKG